MDFKNAKNQIDNFLKHEQFMNRDHFTFVPSKRLVKSLKGSKSRLMRQSLDAIWNEFSKNSNDIKFDNCSEIIENVEMEIYKKIHLYLANQNADLLYEIALSITAWGGVSGFRQSLGVKGFLNPSNFYLNQHIYKKMVTSIQSFVENRSEAYLNEIEINANQLLGLGVSFGTKHLKFWSGDKLPIWDVRISLFYFKCKPKWSNYFQYQDFLGNQSEINNLPVGHLERLMFNYLDYLEL